jgi:predicted ATPase/DNA-binding SARP family transcriptional activator/tetratricopeptide (TPR) repeat protein
MSRCAIFAMGPLRIELDGRHLTTSRHKAMALLVYLAIKKESCRREELAAFFWPEFGQASAYAYLRRTLWEIKTMLGDAWLKVDRAEVGIHPKAELWLDVSEFRNQVTSLDGHPHSKAQTCPQCIETLCSAARLARDDFLTGFSLRDSAAFDDWQFFQAEQLRREVAGVLKRLVLGLQGSGSYNTALEYAKRWVAMDLLNEEAHRQVMQLFALQGERNAALYQYRECERIIHDELKESPEKETIRLYHQIQAGTTMLEPVSQAEKGGIATPALPPGSTTLLKQVLSIHGNTPLLRNLPPQGTPFVGRRGELKKIRQALDDPNCWLLTLLGPGGIGKTRLAIQTALEYSGAFANGVDFVPLVAVDSQLSINAAIAKSLGLEFRPSGPPPEQQICNYLSDKQILFVLDTFEHLVEWAELLQRIHAQARKVKFLVTSRHRLQLQGEWVLNIRGMKHPVKMPSTIDEIKAYSAVDLFLQAARRARADFQVTEEDLSAITRLTTILDGMPLGLELAANWIRALSCEDIVTEVSRNPDFLETQLRDIPARHRSLQAVFDQSWNLLSRRDQRLFPRLSIFRDTFSYTAAEQIAGISLQELAGLADKSLVQRTSEGRFVLHELLRQYGDVRLSKSPAEYNETHGRYSQYFCACMNQWGIMLKSPQQQQAIKGVEADIGNVFSAWNWAIDHCLIDQLKSAIDGLCTYFLRSMRYVDGRKACMKATAAVLKITTEPARKLRSCLLTWEAAFCVNLECLEEACLLLEESRAILDKFPNEQVRPERALFYQVMLLVSFFLGKPEQGADDYEQILVLAQESAGQVTPSILFFWKLLMNAGVFSPRVWSQLERTLPFKRQSGDIFETACLLQTLGVKAGYLDNELAGMAALMEESIVLFQQLDDPISQSLLLDSVNTLLNIRGQFSDLLPIRQKRLAVAQNLGDRRMIGYTQAEVGETFYHLGEYEKAEDNLRKGMAVLKEGYPYEHALWQQHLANVWLVRARYKDAVELCRSSLAYFNRIGEPGWESTALASLSHAEFALGERELAWEHALESLHILDRIHTLAFFIPRTLAILALLYLDRGNIDMANNLQTQISLQPFWGNSRWYKDLYEDPMRNARTGVLPVDGTVAHLIGSGKDLWEIVKLALEAGRKQ